MKHHIARLSAAIFLIFTLHTALADEITTHNSSVEQEITSIVDSKQNPYLRLSEFPNRADDLKSLYAMANYQLLWRNQEDSEKNIKDGLDVLANAASQGLTPVNYDADALRQKLPAIMKSNSHKDLALYDTALSIAMLRFVHDLHFGRVNPVDVKFNLKPRDKNLIDLPLLIKNSLAQNEVSQLPLLVEPKSKQYQKLKEALTFHRQLAANEKPFKWGAQKNLLPGNRSLEITGLRQFLIGLGDIQNNNADNDLYSDDLVNGVKKFQSRHGLIANGNIEKNTVAAINEPLMQRVTQIELSMERLRWLPEQNAGASIVVNIPAFQLQAYDAVDRDGASATTNMRVVVGKSQDHQTPVLMSDMKYVDFMPYWNVPDSIVKKEILPKLVRNSNYLDRESMELISASGGTEDPVFVEDTISQIKHGKLRIRQRSGGKNALGKVKFVFPNKFSVYLHDTQSKSFFSRSRRDFSHGCVRVSEPQRLAEFVLKDNKGWDVDAIRKAMSTTKSRQVSLAKPIPVLFFYATAYFDQADNLTFYSDIYGHDALLLAALSKHGDLSDKSIFTSSESPERDVNNEELGV